ncbi:MAG: cupin domain-containing protein [Nitrospinae bacterium]|nr:cupin domain-containing protein [Nitrospinota bacterium]
MKTLKGDKSEVEKGWYSRGLIRSLWIDHACQVGGNDLHGTDELFMALAGELELEIEGRQFQQKIVEKILIPAHLLHPVTEHRE